MLDLPKALVHVPITPAFLAMTVDQRGPLRLDLRQKTVDLALIAEFGDIRCDRGFQPVAGAAGEIGLVERSCLRGQQDTEMRRAFSTGRGLFGQIQAEEPFKLGLGI